MVTTASARGLRVCVAIEYDDPSDTAALAWTTEHVFGPIPGYLSAEVVSSIESFDETAPGDLVHTIEATFEVDASDEAAAASFIVGEVRRRGFDALPGTSVNGVEIER